MKRYIIEGIGTFLLALAIVLTGNPLAIGFMLTTLILIGGAISGGHYNPIITLALCLCHRISMHRVAFYMAAQTAGALAAVVLFSLISGSNFNPEISPELPLWIAGLMEFLLSGLFCMTVLKVTEKHDHNNHGMHHAPIFAGLTLMTIIFIGGLFNPAVAVASMIHGLLKSTGTVSSQQLLVHVLAPTLAAICAAFGHQSLNKK